MQAEWGHKWVEVKVEVFHKRFDSTKQKYSHLFQVVTFLINFLHKRRMDLTYKIIGDQNANPIVDGWVGDF